MAATKNDSLKKTVDPDVKKSVAKPEPIQNSAAKPARTAGNGAAAKKPAVKPESKTKAPVKSSDAAQAGTAPKTQKKAAEQKAAPVREIPIKSDPETIVVSAKPAAKKVLFAASEVLPFAASGGLGEVAGSLPAAVNKASEAGYDVRVVMPYYKNQIAQEYREQMTELGHATVHLAWRQQYCGVFKLVRGGVTYYFLDNEYYYKRNNLYGEYDDGERFAFFSKAVLDVMPMIDFYPDILHCNDWQTALIPVYYKLYYMYLFKYEGIKTIFTVHNIEYQGKFGYNCCEDLFGIPARECASISFDNCINLMKGAIDYCDAVTTVSPTYAGEIQSDYFAHGLAPCIARNHHKLSGILNGIDTEGYCAATDKSLFVNFDADTLDKKSENKTELQKMLNLTVDANVPMVAMITRLVAHKGVDLVKYAAQQLMQQNVQFVVLGTGNAEYEAFFRHLQTQYPTKMAAIIAYNKDLSRKIYAAADVFLMPSKSEPCGLSQMIASRYGTVPVVRETGGLYDSIKDCSDGRVGNGYTFATYNADDMLHALDRALGLYRNYPEVWRELSRRIIKTDFSWTRSAKEYMKLYDGLIGDRYR